MALIHALLMLLGIGLAVGVLLFVVLGLLMCLLLRLLGIHTAPTAAAVRLLPAGTGVLVNISIVAGVHVAVGGLPDGGVPVGCTVPAAFPPWDPLAEATVPFAVE